MCTQNEQLDVNPIAVMVLSISYTLMLHSLSHYPSLLHIPFSHTATNSHTSTRARRIFGEQENEIVNRSRDGEGLILGEL